MPAISFIHDFSDIMPSSSLLDVIFTYSLFFHALRTFAYILQVYILKSEKRL